MDTFERKLMRGEDAIIQGEYAKGIEILENAIKRPKLEFSTRATIHSLLGEAYVAVKAFDLALFHHKRDLDIGRSNNHMDGQARACANIAMSHIVQNNFKDAVAAVGDLQKIAEMISDEYDKKLIFCKANYLLGMAHLEHSVRPLHAESQLQDENNDAPSNSVGEQEPDTMEYYLKEAISYFDKQLEVAIEIDARTWENLAIGNLANVYYYLQEYQKAIDLYEQRLSIAQSYEDVAAQLSTLTNIANTYVQIGDFSQSSNYYQQALALSLTQKQLRSKSAMEKVDDVESDGYSRWDQDTDTYITDQSPRRASFAMSNSKRYKSTSDVLYGRASRKFGSSNPKSKNDLTRSRTLSKVHEANASNTQVFLPADVRMFDREEGEPTIIRRRTIFGAPFSFVKRSLRRLSMNIG